MVSGQAVLKACLKLEGCCRGTGFHVVFNWIPAHVGIDGNEKADELAKAAAVRGPLPVEAGQLISLGAAAKRVVGERSKMDWVQAWRKEKTSGPTKRPVKAPVPQVLRHWKWLRKASSSVLIQRHTGRIGLNENLTCINISQDARCGCGLGNQDPQHIVMECPFLLELRADMWRNLWSRRVPGSLSFNQLIQEPKATLSVAGFMLKTGLLSQFQVVDPVATGSTQEQDNNN
jgi:ribonuclease HI